MTRYERIAQCNELMYWAIEVQNERRELIAVVGELDQLNELHRLLYEEKENEMNHEAWEMVREFHARQGFPAPDEPTKLEPHIALLRQRLILEELGELAIAVHTSNLVEVADAGADLAYVLHGTAVSAGLKSESAFDAKNTEAIDAPKMLGYVTEAVNVLIYELGWYADKPSRIVRAVDLAVLATARLLATYDVPFEECFREVQRSNMTKQALTKEEVARGAKGGVKGDKFELPNLRAILLEAGLVV